MGVAQLLGLIAQFAWLRISCFWIESRRKRESSNPEGLKALLRVIESKAQSNQFVISTHSNIILRNSGYDPVSKHCMLREVSAEVTHVNGLRLPRTTVRPGAGMRWQKTNKAAHLNSAYELSDLDLYDGWLILEESPGGGGGADQPHLPSAVRSRAPDGCGRLQPQREP